MEIEHFVAHVCNLKLKKKGGEKMTVTHFVEESESIYR